MSSFVDRVRKWNCSEKRSPYERLAIQGIGVGPTSTTAPSRTPKELEDTVLIAHDCAIHRDNATPDASKSCGGRRIQL